MSAATLPTVPSTAPAASGTDAHAGATATGKKRERDVRVALLLLVFALPLKPLLNLDEVAQIESLSLISLTKVAGVGFVVCLWRYARETPRPIRLDVVHVLLVGLLLIAIAASAQARAPGLAVGTTLRYASCAALFFAMTHLLVDRRLVRQVLWVLVGSCALAGAIAVHRLLTEQSLRATLPYGNANDVAFVLATVLPLGVGLMVESYRAPVGGTLRRWIVTAVAMLMSAAIAVSVALSFSRGALVGLAVAMLPAISISRQRLMRALVIVCTLTLALGLLLAIDNSSVIVRGLRAKQHVAGANVTNRLQAWDEAVNLATAFPLGVGPGNFQFYYADRWQPGMHRLTVVHNTFLEIAAELGVPGLCLFVLFIVMAIVRLTRIMRDPPGPAVLAHAVRSALVVAIVAGLFVSEQFAPSIWLLTALAYAVWQTRRDES